MGFKLERHGLFFRLLGFCCLCVPVPSCVGGWVGGRSGVRVCLFACLCLRVCVCVSVFACLCVCLPACLPFCLSVSQPVSESVSQSVTLSLCHSVTLPLCYSVTLSVCLSVCLAVCLSVWLLVCSSCSIGSRSFNQGPALFIGLNTQIGQHHESLKCSEECEGKNVGG